MRRGRVDDSGFSIARHGLWRLPLLTHQPGCPDQPTWWSWPAAQTASLWVIVYDVAAAGTTYRWVVVEWGRWLHTTFTAIGGLAHPDNHHTIT